MRPGIVYSYVNHLGDVAMCVKRRGVVRELVMHPNGTISAWKPLEVGTWASLHVGETESEAVAVAWMAS